MAVKEPKAMEEIHRIREKQYLETKGMNKEEERKYFRRKIETLKTKYNINLPVLHTAGNVKSKIHTL